MNKKLKKLLNNPQLFFKDMYFKRSTQIKKYLPIKYTGTNHFTIVTAVYNVEKYLDDFFTSIKNQSLDFKKHIQIICVDDGSTDNSAIIIQKWQKKYPKNIQYIYKENGGQASARNLGLEYVETEWVTFTDPDDFLHPDYFKEIDQKISNYQNLKMAVCNLHFYFENLKITKDTHPLRHRFHTKNDVVDISKLNNELNLSAASTFFQVKEIKQNNLYFDHRVYPNFEDGKFIADYLLYCSGSVAFVNKAIYFYRKRSDTTSTLDKSWEKAEKFDNVLNYGFLHMLKTYQEKYGYVPKNIQKVAIYDMAWYIQYLLNKPEKTNFLTEEQKNKYYDLYQQIFNYIDTQNIMEFNMAKVWFFHKVGMLGAFKGERPPFQIAYIEKIDREKEQVLITYFTFFNVPVSYQIEEDLIPNYQKTVIHSFNESLFTHEKRAWISYKGRNPNASLRIFIDNKEARISVKGKNFTQGISIQQLLELYKPSNKYISDGSWLFMDRETKADDNAEHLYRFMKQNHPEQKCYFVINKSSSDWERLKLEGFNLVDFESEEYEKHLFKASKIISSHLEAHINNFFGDNYEFSKKFIFLQHGITIHNLSAWLNTKKNLECLITATHPEYHSIADNYNTYRLSHKEVQLTGFPRHDSLLNSSIKTENIILIMPTWRSYLMGDHIGKGANTRTLNENFMQTEYSNHWYSLLHSQQLKTLAIDYNYQIIFAPHPNIEPYLPLFEVPTYIDTWSISSNRNSIQSLFRKSRLLITDYSSVTFEMALLNKGTIYYQFDHKIFFSGNHTSQLGYFTYEKDGFGPVVETEKELLEQLEKVLKNHGEPFEPYATRIRETFPFRDGQNCKRVYEAIISLDQPDNTQPSTDMLYKYCQQAIQSSQWGLAEKRANSLLKQLHNQENTDLALYNRTQHLLARAYFNQSKFAELLELVSNNDEKASYWQARLAFWSEDYQKALSYFEQYHTSNIHDLLRYLWCYAELHDAPAFITLKEKIDSFELNRSQQAIVNIIEAVLKKNYQLATDLIDQYLEDATLLEKRQYQLELTAAKLYTQFGLYQKAHQYLVSFEKHTNDHPKCRMAIAHLAFAQENYSKCVNQIDKIGLENNINYLPEYIKIEYIKALFELNHLEKLDQTLQMLAQDKTINEHHDITVIKVKLLSKKKQWKDLIYLIQNIPTSVYPLIIYEHVLAYVRLGELDRALSIYEKPNYRHSYEYWRLIKDLAFLTNHKELLLFCVKGILSIYPDKTNQADINELKELYSII